MALKKFLFGSVLLFFVTSGQAQFGINVKYSSNNVNDWSRITRQESDGPIFENHLEFALDYWFKPGEYRAEYMIEGTFASHTTTLGSRSYTLDIFGLGVKSNLYIFDFRGDCDCPTFKKEGKLFKKGFFLQWNANAGFWKKNASFFNEGHNNIAFDMGAGAGIDIGLSDLITITPFVTYQYFPWLTWEQFSINHGIRDDQNLNAKITASMLKFGIRLGLRADFLREQRILRR